jgi:hypothetical protein
VHIGQELNASDVIAEGTPLGKHILLDLRRALNISKPSEVNKMITCKVGDHLQKEDIIAETKGLFRRIVRAPQDCTISTISGGQVLIELKNESQPLLAGLPGRVIEILPERGAIIESHGALLQGVWGNGGIGEGLLVIMSDSPDTQLTAANLDVSMRGGMIVAGYCDDAEALKIAETLSLRGLILGSMTAKLLPAAEKLPFPVILLEGVGRTPINPTAFAIISAHDRRVVAMNATNWDSFAGDRPEVLIPLPARGEPSREADIHREGQMVRVHGTPYSGKIGTLLRIYPGAKTIANGIRAQAGDVRLDDNNKQEVCLPLMNLEILQ